MSSKNRMVLIFTGSVIIIERIKTELEQNGIFSIAKDGFRQGIEAGFGGGVPSAIDIYVIESDEKKAKEIVHILVKGNS